MDALRGSIAWLRKMDAISEEDAKTIRAASDARNELAHELTDMLGGSKPPQFTDHFSALVKLVEKIEKWWIINVEIPTDPEFDGEEVDENGIVPGSILMMHLLSSVAMGWDDEVWELYRQSGKLRPNPKVN